MLLNTYAIIGVMGHFISEEGKHYYIVLRLRKIISKYTSKNIVGVLIDLFRDYRIIGNIRYFMADNTDLNDMCINAILYTLYLNILVNIRKGYRLYCFSYIINLYA
jgi:hypothetical protein